MMPRAKRCAAALATVLLMAGCSDVGGTGDLEYVSGDGRVVEVPAEGREDPLAFAGTTVEAEAGGTADQDGSLDIADLRGQVVVVNVWWSGCVPCRTEMPMLVEAERELAAEHPGETSFLGINIRDLAPENAASFERDRGVDYPSLYDPGSETLLEMGDYAPYAPPATLVLDREGRVAALINGPIPSKTTLTTIVEDTLAEGDS